MHSLSKKDCNTILSIFLFEIDLIAYILKAEFVERDLFSEILRTLLQAIL